MRDAGLERAFKAAGGVASLARAIGIAQPSVSAWSRIPAERVLAIEALTHVPRSILRPDLYGPAEGQGPARSDVVEINALRAAEYGDPATNTWVVNVAWPSALAMKWTWAGRNGWRPVVFSSCPTGPSCGIG